MRRIAAHETSRLGPDRLGKGARRRPEIGADFVVVHETGRGTVAWVQRWTRLTRRVV
jgi:hypothetical protein